MGNRQHADMPQFTRRAALGGALCSASAQRRGVRSARVMHESHDPIARDSRVSSSTAPKWQEAGDRLPKHCILTDEFNDRTGADGKRYAIGFEKRLSGRMERAFSRISPRVRNDWFVLSACYTGAQPKVLYPGL